MRDPQDAARVTVNVTASFAGSCSRSRFLGAWTSSAVFVYSFDKRGFLGASCVVLFYGFDKSRFLGAWMSDVVLFTDLIRARELIGRLMGAVKLIFCLLCSFCVCMCVCVCVFSFTDEFSYITVPQ